MGTRSRLSLVVEDPKPDPRVRDVKKIMDSVVVLDIIFHRPTIRRKADMALVETEADKSMLGLTKAIVISKEYQDVCRVATETRCWLGKRALPSPLRRGTYLIPVTMIGAISDYLDSIDRIYQERVEQFLTAYPDLCVEAKERLGKHYNAEDYPSVLKLRSAFSIERRMLDFGVPSQDKLGRALWEQEKQRAESTWQSAILEIQEALRIAFRDLVSHLADRLSSNPDGSRKIFKNSAVTKLTEFVDLFKDRNLTNDQELEGLVIQARNVLSGKRPDSLRKNNIRREEVAGEMNRVLSALDTLLENAPRRSIRFDDEEE